MKKINKYSRLILSLFLVCIDFLYVLIYSASGHNFRFELKEIGSILCIFITALFLFINIIFKNKILENIINKLLLLLLPLLQVIFVYVFLTLIKLNLSSFLDYVFLLFFMIVITYLIIYNFISILVPIFNSSKPLFDMFRRACRS